MLEAPTIDQASGLRRLFGHGAARIVPVLGAERDARLVARLARALQSGGERVVVIDRVVAEQALPADTLVLHPTRPAALVRIVSPDVEALVLVGAGDARLAAAYRAIKLAAPAHRCFKVVVCDVADRSAALRTFDRIARTTERFLGFVPAYAGYLPSESIASVGSLVPATYAIERA